MKERPTVDVIRLASDKGRLARSKERHEICHVLLPHEMFGAPKTNRTSDLPLRRGLLYPLSYRGVRLKKTGGQAKKLDSTTTYD